MSNEQTVFTSQDIDRLLGLADQFLEEWEAMADESGDPRDLSEYRGRKAEFDKARPLMVAAPELLDFAETVLRGNTEYADLERMAAELILKAKGA